MDIPTKKVDGRLLFMGNKLEIFIPTRYEQHGALEVGNKVMSMAVFDMLHDGKKCGCYLPAKITMIPSEVEHITKDEVRYVHVILKKGDVLMESTKVVKEWKLGYAIFYEWIYGGKKPEFVDYESSAYIFDRLREVCGISFPTDHAIFEMFSAMLYRDSKDISLQYRLGKMDKPPVGIPMRTVEHAAMSTTGKIVGSYINDGIDASLINAGDNSSDIEDILRT